MMNSTRMLSRLIYVPGRRLRKGQSLLNQSRGGVFVGITEDFGRPYFVNFDSLVNPHVFVVGMTGSGKSYLIRSLALRLRDILESKVVLIDFTGEYSESLSLLMTEENSSRSVKELESKDVFYANLNGRDETTKISEANKILEDTVGYIRNRKDSKRKVFVILDEAWKLIKSGGPLEILLREGRKYGVGIIFASQLIEDIELAKVANVATIFAFRIQNKQSVEKLKRNYSLEERFAERIRGLQVGSCLLIQLFKAEKREAVIIKRVIEVSLQKPISIGVGDGITVEIDMAAFENSIKKLAGGRDVTEILQLVNRTKGIELCELIEKLLRLGVSRGKTLSMLRRMKINDYDIADAFARAVDELGAVDEEENRF